ncbi:hypothetical protein NCAS_0A05600 [Naumovozyma castellii]|uniref:histone acetyltransferase n=1 Tax=Naumovozyma castellii TaxID=27288 RepID=G0V6M2_NAUCA|nr:hypothetical protein NCAS_0A05600 [Naumovozyma castellii CBS 4309]CCC67118.1 hypothetical protein NCAS_0A05600 [Naumovozyma castellii CBS 4309]
MSLNGTHTLDELLASVLPRGHDFELLHLQDEPAQTHDIVTPMPTTQERADTLTVKIQHFFTLFHNKKAVFALEIYVYLTLSSLHNTKLIFVSKADTSGYCDIKLRMGDITKVFLQYLISVDPLHYLRKVKPLRRVNDHDESLIRKGTSVERSLRILAVRVDLSPHPCQNTDKFYITRNDVGGDTNWVTKICLFTRPADDYLFIGSSKNAKKHKLNGDQLLKWWMKIIDGLVCTDFDPNNVSARLRVPGEDTGRVSRTYLNGDLTQSNNWQVGDIFGGTGNDLAVFHVPLFPDDPKSRFIRHLVQENRIMKTNLKTYWMELQERQEFKLSVIVSVIGVEGHTKKIPDYLPNDREIFICSSRRQFRYIRSYVAGEEYDNEEGTLESYVNVRDYLELRYSKKLLKLSGTREPEIRKPVVASTTKRSAIPVTLLQPRKKAKPAK